MKRTKLNNSLDLDAIERNLRRAGTEAQAQLWPGANWYCEAEAGIESLALELGQPKARVAAVMGIWSPRSAVKTATRKATEYLRGGKPLAFSGSIYPALALYEKTGKIGGPKVSAFAAACAGDQEAVVLDVWMAHVCGVPQVIFKTPNRYEAVAGVLRSVARSFGVSPAAFQASLWTVARTRGGDGSMFPKPLPTQDQE